MKIKIYRGTKEIGGNCIELTANNGKVLWIDLGAPLDTKNPDISYAKNKVDALLISHPHQDHYGLMDYVDKSVPVYIGGVSFDLIMATKIFRGKPLPTGNFKTFNPWESIPDLDTFKVYPYLVDHSSPEAFAFIIDVDDKRVFYSGDFRSTGWKRKLYYQLLNYPPKDKTVDLFLTEGTMAERIDPPDYPTEMLVYKAINAIVSTQKNTTFVVSSGQNIDRLVSLVKACNTNGKTLIVDVYTAWVLDTVHKKSPNLPTIDWEVIKVYNDKSQLRRITGTEYDAFRDRVIGNDIGDRLYESPQKYVYFLRCPNPELVKVLCRKTKRKVNIIYSQWKGYFEGVHKGYCADIIQGLVNLGHADLKHIHTSGHANLFAIKRLAGAVKPKIIVPIHTEYPVELKREFEKDGFTNVELWDDGIEYQL
jgi:ribonuclease J